MHGTFNPHATECYAEGLRMPPLKLYENDEPDKPIWDLIDMNIRVPNERVAERYAQYQAGRAGRAAPARLRREVRRAGRSATRSRTRWTTPSALFREWVRRLPDGAYEFTDWGDRDIGTRGPAADQGAR